MLAFSDVSTSPGSRPRAGLKVPRFFPIRLGGIGAGTSSFKPIAIKEGSREWRCRRGDGGGWFSGGLVGGMAVFEQAEQEEFTKEERLKRKERVGTVFESGRAAELGVGRVPLEGRAA